MRPALARRRSCGRCTSRSSTNSRLIAELGYEPLFPDRARHRAFARGARHPLPGPRLGCQLAVCFCLGITEVDPARMSMLMERFISRERNEPPDIDVDFEHERREEVIQYIYGKYGRDRAALTATVITYCPRSAVRDVGRALGLSGLQVEQLARAMQWWDGRRIEDERIVEAGLDPASPMVRRLMLLARELIGFPAPPLAARGRLRHFPRAAVRLVPVENAAMDEPHGHPVGQGRSRRSRPAQGRCAGPRDAVGHPPQPGARQRLRRPRPDARRACPPRIRAVYDMIGRADTMGVFQIESRAQMAMLPRLRPRCYYDLVIEVAIIRPGPIQGDMVHPYLRRRNERGTGDLSQPGGARGAGADPRRADIPGAGDAAGHRRGGFYARARPTSCAGPWRRGSGAAGSGRSSNASWTACSAAATRTEFAQQIFRQILGFGEYGFPESHAASFALLVYVSAWLKCHEPAAFTCALLNSQPMGFYAPDPTRAGRARGTASRCGRSMSMRASWDCTLEPGCRRASRRCGSACGWRAACPRRADAEPGRGPRQGRRSPACRTWVSAPGSGAQDLGALAAAGRWPVSRDTGTARAGKSPASSRRYRCCRRCASPRASRCCARPPKGEDIAGRLPEPGPDPGPPSAGAAARRGCAGTRVLSAADSLGARTHGSLVHAAGLVMTRQTAGQRQWRRLRDARGRDGSRQPDRLAERRRAAAARRCCSRRCMGVWGEVQREGDVLHVIAGRLEDYSALLGQLRVARSRDFH